MSLAWAGVLTFLCCAALLPVMQRLLDQAAKWWQSRTRRNP